MYYILYAIYYTICICNDLFAYFNIQSLVPDQHFFCETSAKVTEDANTLVSGATNTQGWC